MRVTDDNLYERLCYIFCCISNLLVGLFWEMSSEIGQIDISFTFGENAEKPGLVVPEISAKLKPTEACN